MTSGIYRIRVTDKQYIGSSKQIEWRWGQHIANLQQGCHVNSHLQRLWDKYGESDFKFEIIEECSTDRLENREQFWIDSTPRDSLINICLLVGHSSGMLGRRHSVETRQQMSKNHRGGPRQKKSKMTWDKVRNLRAGYTRGQSVQVLAEKFKIDHLYAQCIIDHEIWVEEV